MFLLFCKIEGHPWGAVRPATLRFDDREYAEIVAARYRAFYPRMQFEIRAA